MKTKRRFLAFILTILIMTSGVVVRAQDALTESYTTDDGRLSLNYPNGWQVQGTPFSITIATDVAALAQSPAPSGEAALAIIFQSPATFTISSTTLVDAVKEIAARLNSPTDEPVEITVAGRAAAQARINDPARGDGYLVVFDPGIGEYVVALLASASGEMAQFEPTLRAILDSAQAGSGTAAPTASGQADQTQTYTSTKGRFSLSYPSEWHVLENSNIIFLGTDETLLDSGLLPEVGPGQAAMSISFSSRTSPNSQAFFKNQTSAHGLAASFGAFWGAGAFGDVTDMTVAGRPAARVIGSPPGSPLDMVMWGIELGNGELAMVVGQTAAGELTTFEPVFEAVVESLQDADNPAPSGGSVAATTAPPAPAAQDELTQTFTSSDGEIVMKYPTGWLATGGFGFVQFIKDASQPTSGTLPPGQVFMMIQWGNSGTLGLQGSTPAEMTEGIRAPQGAPMSDPVEVSVAGLSAASSEGSIPNESDFLFMVIDLGTGSTAEVTAFTAPGELAGFKPTLIAMLNTLGGASGDTGATTAVTPTESSAQAETPSLHLEPALLWSVKLRGDNAQDVAFSPDDTLIAAVGTLGTSGPPANDIVLLDAATGNLIRLLSGHTGLIYRLAFSPDGTILASASSDGTVRLWDVATGTEKLSVNKGAQVKEMAFSPFGDLVTYITDGNPDALWALDIAAGRDFSLTTFDEGGRGMAITPNGVAVLFNTIQSDQTVKHTTTVLWDLTSNTEAISADHEGEAVGAFFGSDGTPLVALSVAETKEVRIGNVVDNDLLFTLFPAMTRGGDAVTTVRTVLDPTGTLLARAAVNADTDIWATDIGVYEATLNRDNASSGDGPLGFAFSSQGKWLAVSYEQGSVEMWRLSGEGLPPASTLSSAPAQPTAAEANPASPTTEPNTNAAVTCTVTPPQTVNLRSGPGTTFARAGSLTAGQSATIDGQAQGADGQTWYHSSDGWWVRGDVANAPPDCASVPVVEP